MNSCEKYSELISLYIDGMISKSQEADLLNHIKTCDKCAEELFYFTSLIKELNTLPPLPLPNGFHESAMSKIKDVDLNNKNNLFGFSFKFKLNAPVFASIIVCFLSLSVAFAFLGKIAIPAKDNMYAKYETFAEPSSYDESAGSSSNTAPYEKGEILESAPMAPFTSEDSMNDESLSYSKESVADMPSSDMEKKVAPESPALLGGRSLKPSITTDSSNVIVFNTNIIVTVNSLKDIAALLKALPVTVEYSNIQSINAEYTLRVNREDYEAVKDSLNSSGILISSLDSSYVATGDYNELSATLKAKNTEKTRLIELFNKAYDVSSVLTIENKLSTVQNEIDKLQSKINLLATDNTSPVINVYFMLEEPIKPPVENLSFSQEVQTALISSFNGTVAISENLIVLFSFLSVPIVIVIIIATIVIFIRKRRSSK